ncbi:hypothetical protein ALC57_06265 [Trachymyrmex cornetzi]|uniref:Uncharacterized protein n=1 Tax=Trachymyrmex cornetzi TaxID=471704 RepID=A0A195E7Z3_9HYME|nr:hypothetical protein ALC57_06265 [Trachymyrmex cornetzi]
MDRDRGFSSFQPLIIPTIQPADSHLLNNPIRPSTCTRVKLVTFEGYSYTIVLKNVVELITVISIFKSKHLSRMMNLRFYLIKIRRANSAAD